MSHHKILYLLATACLAFAAPAVGAKPVSGGSSIAIATINGATMAASTTAPIPKLGDSLTFATRIEPLAGWEYPMVALSCYQDVNGDGTVDTNLRGPDIVFGQLDKPSTTFTLGGYSSIWTQRGGGNAVCRAELDAYGWKGGKESARVLATTGNWAAQG
jgi:hypothetical protein